VQAAFIDDHIAALLAHLGDALDPWKHVGDFAEEIENWVSRFGFASEPGSDVAVRVMTLQGAKGLAEDTVCVLGLEEGTIPRKGSDGEELAEQSRLLFVSMTRAKTDLHLFHARNRSTAVSFQQIHGKGGDHVLSPSRFLAVIPKECCQRKFHPARNSRP